MNKKCCFSKQLSKYRITDCHMNGNECKFKCNGKQFYGTGQKMFGCHRAIHKHTYQWRITDDSDTFYTSISVNSRDELFNHKLFLARCMKEAIERTKQLNKEENS